MKQRPDIEENALYGLWSAAVLLGTTTTELQQSGIKPLQGRNGQYLGRDLLKWWDSNN